MNIKYSNCDNIRVPVQRTSSLNKEETMKPTKTPDNKEKAPRSSTPRRPRPQPQMQVNDPLAIAVGGGGAEGAVQPPVGQQHPVGQQPPVGQLPHGVQQLQGAHGVQPQGAHGVQTQVAMTRGDQEQQADNGDQQMDTEMKENSAKKMRMQVGNVEAASIETIEEQCSR